MRIFDRRTGLRSLIAGLAVSFSAPLLVVGLGLHLSSDVSAAFARNLPGLTAFAADNRYPQAALIGVAVAMICGALVAIMLVISDPDVEAASKNLQLTPTKRIIYPLGGVLLFVFPWFKDTGRGGRFSYWFFELVNTQPPILGLFTSLEYILSLGVVMSFWFALRIR